MDFSDKELSKFDFSISLIIIFNPKLLPKVPKPSEADYQDTKLLFYYPDESTRQEEKRNQVGLVEGSYHFWDLFSTVANEDILGQSGGFQIIYLQDYVHVLKEVENDFWLFFVLKPVVTGVTLKTIENDYLNIQSFSYAEEGFSEENLKKFIGNFYQNFFLFHGSFSSYFLMEVNEMNKEFNALMREFVRNYLNMNSTNGQILNILKYNFTGVNYSPIDKKKFLSMQYLINIMQSIEKKLEHFALFYSGYLIFSTFDQKDLQLLYDYFYVSNTACEIDQGKIANKFEKSMKNDEKSNNNNVFYGVLNKPIGFPNGFLYGPINLNDQKTANGSKNEEIVVFSPVIHIHDPNKKSLIKQRLFAFLDKNLLLLMTCDSEESVEKLKFLELQTAILANSEKLSQNLEKQLLKIAGQSENYRMVYFNKMNLALKVSNKISISALDFETLKFIDEIKTELEKNNKMFICFKKSTNFWIYGLKGNSRIVAFLIPANISFQKVEEEKEEIIKFFFSNIFL